MGVPLAAILALALIATNINFVAADGGTPHSGMRTFLTTVPVDKHTLYVVAPDYMAPDLAYYARGKNIRFLGFARLNHSEYYVLDDYAALWNDPLVVEKAVTAIRAEQTRYRYLVVIVDSWTHDAHEIPFSKARELVVKLEDHYRLVSQVNYVGRWEPVSVYRFDMTAHRS
jgi:hypothetical protein